MIGRLRALNLGAVGFGGAPLGNLYAPIDPETALGAVRRAWDLGIRHFDTAPLYGQGLSEHRIGHILREKPRGEFVLSTKVGRLLAPDPEAPDTQHGFVGTLPFVLRYDYSYDGALRSLEDSCHRLGLARIDIAYIHDIDRFTHGDEQPRRFREAMDGAYKALERLRAAGVLKAIGLGVNNWEMCRDALRHGDFDGFLLAGRYTLLDQTALPELLPMCVERGAGVVIGGPYNSGILASGAVPGAYYNYAPATPEMLSKVGKIEAICRQFHVPLRAAALQFPLAHEAVLAVIPGARNAQEVAENVALMNAPIPREFWASLKSAGLLAEHVPTP